MDEDKMPKNWTQIKNCVLSPFRRHEQSTSIIFLTTFTGGTRHRPRPDNRVDITTEPVFRLNLYHLHNKSCSINKRVGLKILRLHHKSCSNKSCIITCVTMKLELITALILATGATTLAQEDEIQYSPRILSRLDSGGRRKKVKDKLEKLKNKKDKGKSPNKPSKKDSSKSSKSDYKDS
eukprot:scaffold6656_cov67-Skeletonema_marinoi.AAC.1